MISRKLKMQSMRENCSLERKLQSGFDPDCSLTVMKVATPPTYILRLDTNEGNAWKIRHRVYKPHLFYFKVH